MIATVDILPGMSSSILTMNNLVPVDKSRMTDVMDGLLLSRDPLDLVLGMIPTQFGISEKATYLGLRACGMDHRAALMSLEMDEDDYAAWIAETPMLDDFTNEHLALLQADAVNNIMKLGFARNMMYYMNLDHRILRQATFEGIDSMSDHAYDYFRTTRKYYTPKQMRDLNQAIEPEKYQKQQVINLSFGPQQNIYEIREGDQVVEAGELVDSDAPQRA